MCQKECLLCKKERELKKSHVIPNAIFRRIFKENNGQAITFQDDSSSLVDYSSDSWWEYLLCENCEKILNTQYEQYSISALRNSLSTVEVVKNKENIVFKSVNAEKIQLFFVSILWRASISTRPEYSKVYLPQEWKEEIRNCLLNQKKVRASLVGIKITRLYDKSVGGFSLKYLKDFLITPFFRKNKNNVSFCFLLEGFFIEIFIPGLKLKERNKIGILKPKMNIFVVPYINVFDIPELVKILVTGYAKNIEGKSKLKS